MHDVAPILLTLGMLMLLGFFADVVSARIKLPRVTILILMGVLIGPPVLGVLPTAAVQWYPLISDVALLIIGFLLGRKLCWSRLRERGRQVVAVSVMEVLGVAVAVFLGLIAVGAPVPQALVLAGIGPASAPAAIMSVVEETRAKGPFTDTLLGVVAIDDAWGLIVFSVLLATAGVLAGDGGGAWDVVQRGGLELGGALVLGVVLGVPGGYLLHRVHSGEPVQAESLALLLICGGLALYFEASFILTAMVLGAAIRNIYPAEKRPFKVIQRLEWPILILFFVLAGAEADIGKLMELGLLGGAYVLLRAAGLAVGAYVGGVMSGATPFHRRWMGAAIQPQAGVALGMALVAGTQLPDLKDEILAVVIGSTILFEMVGPILTRIALDRVGEAGAKRALHARRK